MQDLLSILSNPTSVPPDLRLAIRKMAEDLARELGAGIPVLRRYQNNPSAFVFDFFEFDPGEGPTDYQREILEMVAAYPRVAVYSPHGAGKTALASWLVIWGVLCFPDVKVPTLSSTWRQVSEYLWPEIHKWAGRFNWRKAGLPNPLPRYMNKLSLGLSHVRFSFALSTAKPEFIEGAHAGMLFYVFDEAKSIPDPVWDSAEGAMATEGARAFAISTPGRPAGRFYEICARRPGFEDWHVRRITLEEAVRAGRISREWVEQRRRQWGENSAAFINRVLGEFAEPGEEDVVITRQMVDPLLFSAPEEGEPCVLGVDVGWGRDESVIAVRRGRSLVEVIRHRRKDLKDLTAKILSIAARERAKYSNVYVVVDVVGVGAGVFDFGKTEGVSGVVWIPYNGANKATGFSDRTGALRFANMRAASWWHFRDLISSGYVRHIVYDEALIEDLTSIPWSLNASGAVVLASKDEIREYLGRSPDAGDAAVMAFSFPKLARPGAAPEAWIRGIRELYGTERPAQDLGGAPLSDSLLDSIWGA